MEIYGSQNVSFFPIAFRHVSRPMSSLPRHPSKTFVSQKINLKNIKDHEEFLFWTLHLIPRDLQDWSWSVQHSEKIHGFSSGRGIWTPDMQIMILLFWPTKLSRQETLWLYICGEGRQNPRISDLYGILDPGFYLLFSIFHHDINRTFYLLLYFDFTTAPTKVVHIAIKCFTIRSRNGFGWFHMIKKSQKFQWKNHCAKIILEKSLRSLW